MRIKLLAPYSGAEPGAEIVIEDKQATNLIEAGFAVPINPAKTAKAKKG